VHRGECSLEIVGAGRRLPVRLHLCGGLDAVELDRKRAAIIEPREHEPRASQRVQMPGTSGCKGVPYSWAMFNAALTVRSSRLIVASESIGLLFFDRFSTRRSVAYSANRSVVSLSRRPG
jgi:hypothetical protein